MSGAEASAVSAFARLDDRDDSLTEAPPGAAGVLSARLRVSFAGGDRKSTRLNSSHVRISYAVFCLKKKKTKLTSSQRMKPINTHNTNNDAHQSLADP